MTKRRICPACKEEAAHPVEKDEEGVVRYECASCDAKFRVRPKSAPKAETKKEAAPKEEAAGAEGPEESCDAKIAPYLNEAKVVRNAALNAERLCEKALQALRKADPKNPIDPRDPILFRIGRTLNQTHTTLLTCRIDLDNLIRVIEDASVEPQREKAESP